LNAIDAGNFAMRAEGAVWDHDDDPWRSRRKNIGMTHQFGVVPGTQLNRPSALLMKIEVVGLHLKFMSALAFCMDMQCEFVAMGRFHRDFEIKGAAGA